MSPIEERLVALFKANPAQALNANEILNCASFDGETRTTIMLAIHNLLDNEQIAFTTSRKLTLLGSDVQAIEPAKPAVV